MGENWTYLGDGVYAQFQQFGIMLHANSHNEPTDRIFLEWPVVDSLMTKLNALKKEAEEKSGNSGS